MSDFNESEPKHRSRFTIRSLLALTVVVAICFGWFSAHQRADKWQKRAFSYEERLRAAESQFNFSRGPKSVKTGKPRRGLLSGQKLNGGDFSNVSIKTGASGFQSASLDDANFQNATISCGNAAFQSSSFDRANLQGAQVTGGGTAFQLASFVDADLRGAILVGGAVSFQGASFRGADLTGATIKCATNTGEFQVVDIDSAVFLSADLSTISAGSLESCYFSTPPTYNDKTKFAKDFDPVAAGWTLVQ